MGHTAVLVFVSSPLANVLDLLAKFAFIVKIHTDLTTGDLAMVAVWKLKGLPSLFFSGVAGVKYEV